MTVQKMQTLMLKSRINLDILDISSSACTKMYVFKGFGVRVLNFVIVSMYMVVLITFKCLVKMFSVNWIIRFISLVSNYDPFNE